MLTGSQYVGCMQDVFAAKVDLEAVLQPGGFGGVKMTGDALPHCQFSVEQAYEGEGESYDCVNRRFFDCAVPRASRPSICATSEHPPGRSTVRTLLISFRRVCLSMHLLARSPKADSSLCSAGCPH